MRRTRAGQGGEGGWEGEEGEYRPGSGELDSIVGGGFGYAFWMTGSPREGAQSEHREGWRGGE